MGRVENGSITNCVAHNPSITATGVTDLGRVAGYLQPGGELKNNFARIVGMTLTPDRALDVGGNTVDGENAAAFPSSSWWTSAPPNSPAFSSDIWIFKTGEMPTLKP